MSGSIAGLALAPLTGLLSAARRSRMFHPTGLVCSAHAEPATREALAREVALRLAGPVLLRWSSAWWKTGEWIDVLGCALRFSREPLGSVPQPDDQDLLLATIQRPWTLPFAPWTTDDHDFLANQYFGVSPFEVAPLGRIEWRLSAKDAARHRLAVRAAEPCARCRQRRVARVGAISGSADAANLRAVSAAARASDDRLVELDQRALRFDPFRVGRGLEPVGFVHSLRRATYRSSQALRPAGR